MCRQSGCVGCVPAWNKCAATAWAAPIQCAGRACMLFFAWKQNDCMIVCGWHGPCKFFCTWVWRALKEIYHHQPPPRSQLFRSCAFALCICRMRRGRKLLSIRGCCIATAWSIVPPGRWCPMGRIATTCFAPLVNLVPMYLAEAPPARRLHVILQQCWRERLSLHEPEPVALHVSVCRAGQPPPG